MTDKKGGNVNYKGLVAAKKKTFRKKKCSCSNFAKLRLDKKFQPISGKNKSSRAVTRFSRFALVLCIMYSPVMFIV